jgi:hypothetical protein
MSDFRIEATESHEDGNLGDALYKECNVTLEEIFADGRAVDFRSLAGFGFLTFNEQRWILDFSDNRCAPLIDEGKMEENPIQRLTDGSGRFIANWRCSFTIAGTEHVTVFVVTDHRQIMNVELHPAVYKMINSVLGDPKHTIVKGQTLNMAVGNETVN